MATDRTSNPVRCMTNKNKVKYFERLRNRHATLESVQDAYYIQRDSDRDDLEDDIRDELYELTGENFDVDPDAISKVLTVFNNVKSCNTPPFKGYCKNTLLCDHCLSMWRYKVYKSIQELAGSEDIMLVHYQHDYIVPRGIALDCDDDGRLVLRYLLIDSFSDCYPEAWRHRPLPHQDVPNRIYWTGDFMSDDVELERELEEKSYNDMYSIYNSVITGNLNQCTRNSLFNHSYMSSNIPAYMMAERVMLTSHICGTEFAGVAYRKSMRLVDDNNLLCFTLSAVMPTNISNYSDLGERTRFLLEGGEGALHDYGSNRMINEYKVPFSENSDMYVSNRITVRNIKANSAKLPQFLDRAFPYNATIDNLTPLELLLCYIAITRYDPATGLTGLLRD